MHDRGSNEYERMKITVPSGKAYVRGAGMQVANCIGILILLVSGSVLARIVTPETIGIYSFVMSVTSMMGIIALPGLQTALVRAIATGNEGNYRKSVWMAFSWSWIGGAALGGISIWNFMEGNRELGMSFAISAAAFPLVSITPFYGSYYAGKELWKTATWLWLINAAGAAAGMMTGAYIGKTPEAMMAGYAAGQIATGGVFTGYIFRKARKGKTDEEAIAFGKHLTAAEAISTIAFYLDSVLVGTYLGFEALALYSFAKIIPEQGKSVTKMVASLASPRLSRMSKEEMRAVIFREWGTLTSAMAGLTLVYIVMTPKIFAVFFPAYAEAVPYSQIFSLSMIAFANHLGYQALTTRLDGKAVIHLNIASSFVTIAALMILLPPFGLMGAIIARVGSRLCSLILTAIILKRSLRSEPEKAPA